MTETVEQFLSRGGRIEKLSPEDNATNRKQYFNRDKYPKHAADYSPNLTLVEFARQFDQTYDWAKHKVLTKKLKVISATDGTPTLVTPEEVQRFTAEELPKLKSRKVRL